MYYLLISPLILLAVRTILHIYSSTLLDFSMYLTATNYFLSGNSPYLAVSPQVYPPAFLYFIVPFALIPVQLARFLWTTLSLASLFFSLHLLLKKFPLKAQIFFSLLALQLFPVKFALAQGQINFFVFLGFVLIYQFARTKKDFYAGFTLAIITILKLNPILLLIYFLVQKKYRIIYYTLATLIILNFSINLFSNHDLIFSFVQGTIFRTTNPPLGYYNQSFPALLGRLNLSSLSTLISLTFIIITSFFWYSDCPPPRRDHTNELRVPQNIKSYNFFLLTILLLSPITWQHYLFWSLPAFLYIVTKTKRPNIYLVALSFILINMNLKNPLPFENFQLIYSHATIGLILLYVLLLKSTYKSRVSPHR